MSTIYKHVCVRKTLLLLQVMPNMLQMRQDITGKNTNIAAMNNTRQAAKSTPRTVVEIIMKRAAGVCVCVCVCVYYV